ncbi:MAG: putative SAM-dependent methyltransferase [Candidatus Poriferisodalaceae bacterium]
MVSEGGLQPLTHAEHDPRGWNSLQPEVPRFAWSAPHDGVFGPHTVSTCTASSATSPFTSPSSRPTACRAWLLLGIDLLKPIERLVQAYDDPQGVTAEFSRNVLHVLNRELGADFDVEKFDHIALWDPHQTRMDLRLRANGDHHVRIPDAIVELELYDGEEIRVEISTKFRIPNIAVDVADAGFDIRQIWTDQPGDVALVLASVPRRNLSE